MFYAMHSCLKKSSKTFSLSSERRCMKFVEAMTQRIRFTNDPLTKREQRELGACKLSFTIVLRGRTFPRINDAFYSWCRSTKNPYVTIRYARSHADIWMDLPGISGLLDLEGAKEFQALCLGYDFHGEGDDFKNPGITGLPKEKAAEFARRLVEIGLGFCRRYLAEEDIALIETNH